MSIPTHHHAPSAAAAVPTKGHIMFTLSARKVAIVAVLGAGSVLSAGAFAAQAASTPSADDVVRPASVTSTYDDMPDLRGDGTLEDDGALDVDDDYLDDDGVEDDGVEDDVVDDDYLDDDGVEDDGVEDDDIDVDSTDDGAAPTPAPVAVPTDADHPQGDDSGHDYSDDDDSASDDDSDDDYDDDSDDAGDDSGHDGEED